MARILKAIAHPVRETKRYRIRRESRSLIDRESERVPLYPPTVTVELTNTCNLKCPLCPTGNRSSKRQQGNIDFSSFRKIVDEIAPGTTSLGLHSYGEAILHKDFVKIVSYAGGKGLYTFVDANLNSITTYEKAKKLIDSGIDEIKVSLDGVDQESYSKYRINGSFDTVINAVRWLIEERDKNRGHRPTIKLQFLVMRHNEHLIEEFKELAHAMGVAYSLGSIWIDLQASDITEQRQFLPENKEFSFYRFDKNNNPTLKEGELNYCTHPLRQMLIFWDGTVGFCCMDQRFQVLLGNVLDDGVLKIWNGKKMANMRRRLVDDIHSIPCCKRCPDSIKG